MPYTDITVFQLLLALVVLIVGYVTVQIINVLFKKGLKKSKLPGHVEELLARLLSVLLYVIVIFLAISTQGYPVNALVIGLSTVIGLISGFGLHDTLSSLAAGVWLAFANPIKKGEDVKVCGETGKVNAVGLMATEIILFDNEYITIPNKLVCESPIVNRTRMPTRRVEIAVGISYESDLKKAILVAIDVMKTNTTILADPEPSVVTTELADSSVNLQLRAWVKTESYWTVK